MAGIAQQLVLVDEIRRAERHAVVSRLSRVFAHLIGTPLNVIAARASLIRNGADGADAEAAAENARRIELQVEQLAQRTRRLIEYFTREEAAPRLREVSSIVADALAVYEPVAAARNVEIVCAKSELPAVQVEDTSTLVILTNLLSLAIHTAAAGTRVELVVDRSESRSLLFELNVPGFEPPAARIDRIDPPEQYDPASADRFQVLSICHAIAEQRGGRLELTATGQIRFRCSSR
jgi:signal transduction histidine kinase